MSESYNKRDLLLHLQDDVLRAGELFEGGLEFPLPDRITRLHGAADAAVVEHEVQLLRGCGHHRVAKVGVVTLRLHGDKVYRSKSNVG